MRLREWVCLSFLILALVLLAAEPALCQVNTVDLTGTVFDPQGLAVANAKITVKSLATGAKRSTESNSEGRYQIVGLPPGRYELTVEAKGLATLINPELVLTLGMVAEYDAHVTLAGGQQTVTVTGEPSIVETTRSAVTENVTSTQIDNLPINGRNYINFTLLNSQVQRDAAPSIGAAPTSGLNFGGQRARSNEVSVDGADAVDNSINGVRSTVSQEAVQEFQLIISSYMPEYGRATGGVVNIVTKSGSNETHGNVFGYLRHKSIQARNPFSVQVNPATGAVTAVKQPFTRVQTGATIGGPIQKDKTFYFFSYETTRRQETGFTNIGAGNFGFGSPVSFPFFPAPLLLTGPQKAFVNQLLASGVPPLQQLAAQYAVFAGSGSQFGLTGLDFGAIDANFMVPPCAPPNPQGLFPCFPVPVPGPGGGRFSPSRPTSFVPLTSLIGNYPIKEGTSLWSLRLDHIWNQRNTSFIRANVSPSLVTGIQVNAQNQNFGQNAASRVSLNQVRDLAIVGQHVTTISDSLFNEFRYQFARRGVHYGFSQAPGGSNVGINIPGFAFFGREPFSTVDRIERRNQWTDNMTWTKGHHSIKYGADVNLIQIRSNKSVVFALEFGGNYTFGGLPASFASGGAFPDSVLTPGGVVAVPGVSAVQAYGFGLPQNLVQGVGKSNQPFDNVPLGFFIQDSWKLNSRLTLNYGVRYDIEFTPTFKPATTMNAVAEKSLGVLEGIPVDSNNVAPRFGFAWDPTGSGKTVVRGGYGIFFDHPLLAVAFDSTTADGARNSQLETILGVPNGLPLSSATASSFFNAPSIFQGVLSTTGLAALGITYLPNQQRFDPFNSPFFNNQNYFATGVPFGLLPFTFPVNRTFVYGYAQQANLAVEHELGSGFKVSLSYTYTHGLHLNRPRGINVPDPRLLALNFRNAVAGGQTTLGSSIVVESAKAPTATTCGVTDFNSINPAVPAGILGVLGGCPASIVAQVPNINGQIVATTPVFNFFRPSGPNPSFATTPGVGFDPAKFAALQGLAGMVGFPTGKAGIPVPWSSVDSQESSGNSVYHGFTISLSKRFSHHFQMLSNYTWSHAIDDATDLQANLEPQDDRFPNRDRSNSSFDQRHRWVTSAVFQSPYRTSDDGWWRKFLANFTVSPIFDVASGRPYTVFTGSDVNNDFSAFTDRPSVVRNGTPLPPGTPTATSPLIPGLTFIPATVCNLASGATFSIPPLVIGSTPVPIAPPNGCTGNLGRNSFTRPSFFTIDLRVSRNFKISERWSLDVIAEGYNMLNRFNAADVNPLCDPTSGSCATTGAPSAALDARQFQFALKLNW